MVRNIWFPVSSCVISDIWKINSTIKAVAGCNKLGNLEWLPVFDSWWRSKTTHLHRCQTSSSCSDVTTSMHMSKGVCIKKHFLIDESCSGMSSRLARLRVKTLNHSGNFRKKASDRQNCKAGETNFAHVSTNTGTSNRRISSGGGVHLSSLEDTTLRSALSISTATCTGY
jgi:hypothetical protein